MLGPMRIARLACAGLALVACNRPPGCSGEFCGTLVFVSAGEPETLLPPVLQAAVARDVSDQVFLKLADLGPSTNTIGDADFRPELAERWEWRDSLTLIFHVDPRARWQDGQPVTATDVAFTFAAYTDPQVNSPYRTALRWITGVTAADSLTAVFHFQRRYPEMFYDAIYQMRVLPGHLLRDVPRDQWRSAAFGRAPVGDGPYRFRSWRAGESLELVADSTFFLGRPAIRRLIWRFTPDLQVAVTQLVAGEADALEVLVTPDNVKRVQATPRLATYPYRGSAYAYLGFNLTAPGNAGTPHALFGDRDVRRALAMAVDRTRLVQSVFGDYASVPPGPMSQLWWIWDPTIRELPYDTAQAARLLAARGWGTRDRDGIRNRGGVPFRFRVLVPTTSGVRRQYARLLQEEFHRIGVDMGIDEVEFSVFSERAAAGQFDALIQTWNTDPSPSSGINQEWTTAGIGRSNFLHYSSATFDQLVEEATATFDRDDARRAWRAAIEQVNNDAPAIFLFATQSVAAVDRRVANVTVRPDSWWASVRSWRIPPDQLIARDRVER